MKLQETSYIAKLRSGDQKILEEVYTANYPSIEKMVVGNSGSTDEAKDIFQDAMIIFMKNISKTDFELTASISTYVYAISRRMWMKRLKEKKKLTFSEEDAHIEAFDFELVSKSADGVMAQVVELLMKKGKNCLEILKRIYFNNQSFDYIAGELGYASGQVVREQKYRCIKRVREEIKDLQLTL